MRQGTSAWDRGEGYVAAVYSNLFCGCCLQSLKHQGTQFSQPSVSLESPGEGLSGPPAKGVEVNVGPSAEHASAKAGGECQPPVISPG